MLRLSLRLPVAIARFLLGVVVLIAASAHAQPVTAFFYEAVPAAASGNPVSSRVYTSGPDTFQFASATSGDLDLSITSPSDFALLELQPPIGQTLAVGPYENVVDLLPTSVASGVRISRLNVTDCSLTSGRYVVLEATYDASANMVSFAADLEERCSDGSEVYAEIRYNSAVPMTADKPPTASTPDAFAFPAHAGVLTGEAVVSNVITAYGIRAPAAISITGGEYSVNGGPFTAAPGTVSNRDRVAVRVVASPLVATTTGATLTIGGVAATFDVTTFVPGTPFTAVSLESGTPSVFNGVSSVLAQGPDWTIAASASGGGRRIQVQANSATDAYSFTVQAPLDQLLAVGPYEQAYYSASASPLMTFSSWCEFSGVGRFVIHELVLGATPGTVDSLAASFEQWCTNGQPVFGEIRINSAMPLPAMVTGPRTTPYPFAFAAQSPVRPGTVVASNLTTLDGIDQPVPVSITGGEYSLNGGPFTSAPGTANPRDEVVVRTTASATPGGVQSASFTAGGRSATLSVTTYQEGMALSGIYYRLPPGNYGNLPRSRLLLAPPAGLTLGQVTPSEVAATLTTLGTDGGRWFLDLAAPSGVPLVAGTYEGATRFASSSAPSVDFVGPTSCNELTGRFVVREAVYANDGTPQRFAADFEQQCDTAQFPLYGEIRFNSTVPFSALEPPLAPLPNLSTRGSLGGGDDVLIGGFVIDGTTSKTVAIVATGPSLAASGVAAPLADPKITIVDAATQTVIAANDNWRDDPRAAQLQSSGFAPANDLDSGMVLDLPPGAYTAVVSGVGGATGVGLVAINEIDHPDAPLIALSTRGPVGTGDNVLIGGLVVQGPGPRTVAIVGTGPSLAAAHVANPLANPMLTLVSAAQQTVIATNDDWQQAPNAFQVSASGFAPADTRESVILMSLEPGAYTVILSGAGNTTGVGLISIYDAD